MAYRHEGVELGLDASQAFDDTSTQNGKVSRSMGNGFVSQPLPYSPYVQYSESPPPSGSPRGKPARYVPRPQGASGPYAASPSHRDIDSPRGAQTLEPEPVQAPLPSYQPQPPAVYDPDAINMDMPLRRNSSTTSSQFSPGHAYPPPGSPRAEPPRRELTAPPAPMPQPPASYSPEYFDRPDGRSRPPPVDVTRGSPRTPGSPGRRNSGAGTGDRTRAPAADSPLNRSQDAMRRATPATPKTGIDFRGSAALPLQELETEGRPYAYAAPPPPPPESYSPPAQREVIRRSASPNRGKSPRRRPPPPREVSPSRSRPSPAPAPAPAAASSNELPLYVLADDANGSFNNVSPAPEERVVSVKERVIQPGQTPAPPTYISPTRHPSPQRYGAPVATVVATAPLVPGAKIIAAGPLPAPRPQPTHMLVPILPGAGRGMPPPGVARGPPPMMQLQPRVAIQPPPGALPPGTPVILDPRTNQWVEAR